MAAPIVTIDELVEFTYLESVVSTVGDNDQHLKARPRKAIGQFFELWTDCGSPR